MKFRSDVVTGLVCNEGDGVGKMFRGMSTNERIVVSQGFGVPYKGNDFPLRFLAYIIPVLRLLRQLPKSAIAELYFATQGVIRANGSPDLCNGSVFDIALRMEGAIKKYVALIHPEVANQVRVLHDCVIAPQSPIEQLIDYLSQVAIKVASESVMRFAQRQAEKSANPNVSSSFRYMVEHVLYMRDDFELPIGMSANRSAYYLVPTMLSEYKQLIMVGGPSEKIFHELRQSICRELNGGKVSERNHQVFTPIGSPPTYHLQQGEPVSGKEEVRDIVELLSRTAKAVTSDMGVRQAVLRDLLVLLNDAGGSGDFRWCGKAATGLGRGREPDLPLEVIRCGWNIVRSICC